MPTLPEFTAGGTLPPGDYPMSLAELKESSLVLGPGPPRDHPVWDAAWREQLVENLSVMVKQLWAVGIDEIYIDGSFVEDKDHPNDIDGYFVCAEDRVRTRSLQGSLNRLDPAKCWTWDHTTRRSYRGYPKRQLPMWHSYRVELYPHWVGLVAGRDALGNELEFPAWFRQHRATGRPKGIIKVVQG
ncbi:MAG: hypothetical protein IT431_11850 [Phycisphaerales bacterium]|nr:hypothetical protein [Phycisphaerales bacterium]